MPACGLLNYLLETFLWSVILSEDFSNSAIMHICHRLVWNDLATGL